MKKLLSLIAIIGVIVFLQGCVNDCYTHVKKITGTPVWEKEPDVNAYMEQNEDENLAQMGGRTM
ncbi:MAG: hypothetical protein P9M13_01325 [Candidatus Ancaeobacter aquaticus]|nr:hypothetical protein [Candidatus Ancaeobacter aquaticus]